jgi:hypothetical protein
MNDPHLSSATRALLRAAKADAPGAAARAGIWSGVSSTIGTAAGASAAAAVAGGSAASSATAGGVSAAKMLALGTLLGGSVTVGLAVTMLRIGPAPSVPVATQVGFATQPHTIEQRAAAMRSPPAPIAPEPSAPALCPKPTPPEGASSAQVSAEGARNPSARGARALSGRFDADHPQPRTFSGSKGASQPGGAEAIDDALDREAVLVAEARSALVRGQSRTALRAIRVAMSIPGHRLGPEELAVEAQALRALGREDEARSADALLRKRFPDSALAR